LQKIHCSHQPSINELYSAIAIQNNREEQYMKINQEIIQEIEYERKKIIPQDLKKYLISTYSFEPFPNSYSEENLYNSINKDIDTYELGKLDFKLKTPPERRNEEYKNLKALYIEKCQEA